MSLERRDARCQSRTRGWHPVAFAVFPILSLYSTNAQLAPAGDLLAPLTLALAAVAGIWGAAWLLLRDCERSALLASLAVALLWILAPASRIAGLTAAGTTLLLALLLAALCLRRARRPLPALTRGLDAAGLTLLLVTLAPVAWVAASDLSADGQRHPEARGPAPGTGGSRPDVYYLVLDGFGRGDVLREHYGVREDLASELAALGFTVASRSVSNYNTTLHSLASSLNLDYVQNLVRPSRALAPLLRLIRHNEVARQLQPLGYRFVAFSSGFFVSECRDADEYIDASSALTEFHAAVLALSPLALATPHWTSVSPHRDHRRRVLEGFDRLEALADDPRPTLTFMHVVSPHHPFIFGENGEDAARYDLPFDFARPEVGGNNTSPEVMNAAYVEAYRKQATFVSKRVAAAVKALLERSPEPPIIIVQGDHGPNSREPFTVPGERYPILNAYHLPAAKGEAAGAALAATITPVNSFRVVLNRYFGGKLALLPDRSYRTTWKRPYRFEEVTDPESGVPLPR